MSPSPPQSAGGFGTNAGSGPSTTAPAAKQPVVPTHKVPPAMTQSSAHPASGWDLPTPDSNVSSPLQQSLNSEGHRQDPHSARPFDQLQANDISLNVKPSGDGRFTTDVQGTDAETAVFLPQMGMAAAAYAPVVMSTEYHATVLTDEAEQELTFEIMDLIQSTLTPSQESMARRKKFIAKILYILTKQWPDKGIEVHPFGSTLNGLGTATSDVDICVTTPWDDPVNGVANMHVLASCLRSHGMTRIYTVTKAKVPICKFYDPEFRVVCDINVNNTIALRNTKLIKLYVELDPRVRPVILVIKHWAKQRVLNDAAKGGTLSSYCWVMMALNFLQTRTPPIIPSLHKLYFDRLKSGARVKPIIVDGVDCSFEENIEPLKDFGSKNHETLGGLIYAFFRLYAYEFDYDTQVVSVRHGKLLTKKEKEWDVDIEKMCRHLCIEEPFTPDRNLANSADSVSVSGLRREFRRALQVLGDTASIDATCEPYIMPSKAQQQPSSFGSSSSSGGSPSPSRQRTWSGGSRSGSNQKHGARQHPSNQSLRADSPKGGQLITNNGWKPRTPGTDPLFNTLAPHSLAPFDPSASQFSSIPSGSPHYQLYVSPGIVYPSAVSVIMGYNPMYQADGANYDSSSTATDDGSKSFSSDVVSSAPSQSDSSQDAQRERSTSLNAEPQSSESTLTFSTPPRAAMNGHQQEGMRDGPKEGLRERKKASHESLTPRRPPLQNGWTPHREPQASWNMQAGLAQINDSSKEDYSDQVVSNLAGAYSQQAALQPSTEMGTQYYFPESNQYPQAFYATGFFDAQHAPRRSYLQREGWFDDRLEHPVMEERMNPPPLALGRAMSSASQSRQRSEFQEAGRDPTNRRPGNSSRRSSSAYPPHHPPLPQNHLYDPQSNSPGAPLSPVTDNSASFMHPSAANFASFGEVSAHGPLRKSSGQANSRGNHVHWKNSRNSVDSPGLSANVSSWKRDNVQAVGDQNRRSYMRSNHAEPPMSPINQFSRQGAYPSRKYSEESFSSQGRPHSENGFSRSDRNAGNWTPTDRRHDRSQGRNDGAVSPLTPTIDVSLSNQDDVSPLASPIGNDQRVSLGPDVFLG